MFGRNPKGVGACLTTHEPGHFTRLRVIGYPGRGKTAPGEGIGSIPSVLRFEISDSNAKDVLHRFAQVPFIGEPGRIASHPTPASCSWRPRLERPPRPLTGQWRSAACRRRTR